MIQFPVGEVVRTKLFRFLCFTGAGVVCAVAINKYREFERKSMIQKQKEKLDKE